MANAWPQRALGPWARAKKKGGPRHHRCGTTVGPGRAHGPKALCGQVQKKILLPFQRIYSNESILTCLF